MTTSWIFFAALAYFLMAASQLVDKGFLQVVFKESKAYVFLVGAIGILALLLLPFGIASLSLSLLITALIGGALFILALIPFLSALQSDDASRVIPLLGALIPIGTLVGETIFLDAALSRLDLLGFSLLVVGAVVLTLTKSNSPRRSRLAVIKAITAAFIFAASFVITKFVFNSTDFISGFFYMRLGGIIVAIGLFFLPSVRKDIFLFFTKNKLRTKIGYFANQGLAGTGFILQNIAITMASVSLVNALQGIQYVFIIIFVGIAAKFNPKLLGETITRGIIIEKMTAILIIIAGIAAIAL